jgi:hypothetical protein
MPPCGVQRNACMLAVVWVPPTTTEPSPLTPVAMLKWLSPREPRPTMPPSGVQRKAWEPVPLSAWPTTTRPSAETAQAAAESVGRPLGWPRSTMPPAGVQRKARA